MLSRSLYTAKQAPFPLLASWGCISPQSHHCLGFLKEFWSNWKCKTPMWQKQAVMAQAIFYWPWILNSGSSPPPESHGSHREGEGKVKFKWERKWRWVVGQRMPLCSHLPFVDEWLERHESLDMWTLVLSQPWPWCDLGQDPLPLRTSEAGSPPIIL